MRHSQLHPAPPAIPAARPAPGHIFLVRIPAALALRVLLAIAAALAGAVAAVLRPLPLPLALLLLLYGCQPAGRCSRLGCLQLSHSGAGGLVAVVARRGQLQVVPQVLAQQRGQGVGEAVKEWRGRQSGRTGQA